MVYTLQYKGSGGGGGAKVCMEQLKISSESEHPRLVPPEYTKYR